MTSKVKDMKLAQEDLTGQVEVNVTLAPRRAPQAEENLTARAHRKAGKLFSEMSLRSEEGFACHQIRACNTQDKQSTYIKS